MVACPQLDISAYLFVVSRGVSAPQRVLRESVKPGGAIYGRGAEWDHRFPSWCAPLQLQRHDSRVLELPPVLEHGCRRHDELGRLRDLEDKSSSQHPGSANSGLVPSDYSEHLTDPTC